MIEQNELSVIVRSVGRVVRGYIVTSLKALSGRIDALESRLNSLPTPRDGKDGRDGKDVDIEAVKRFWEEQFSHVPTAEDWNVTLLKILEQIPKIDPEAVRAITREELALTVKSQAETESKVRDAVIAEIKFLLDANAGGLTERIVKFIPKPKDGPPGKDAEPIDMQAVQRMIEQQVALSVGAIPIPRDGKDGVDGTPGPAGKDGIDGKDGLPGTAGERGEKGIDGKDGRDGRDGKDGKDGINGRDALSLEVLSVLDPEKQYPIGTFAHHRGGLVQTTGNGICKVIVNGFMKPSFTFSEDMRSIHCDVEMTNGDRVRETFTVPTPIHRGIFQSGTRYVCGDMVTKSGSMWMCSAESTVTVPGDSKDWAQVVMRGKDGKDLRPEDFIPKEDKPIRLK